MSGRGDDRRLLLVHAHPDDESIGTGATIARYAAEGTQVTLVTCTRGELGEVIPPELAGLATDGDRLGEYRITELAAACAALGIGDQRFLGGPGRWRDSGMMGLPANDSLDCFWQADLATAAAELATVILEVRPQVLVTYDENGFYGHPDHIQAHRVAGAAIGLAASTGHRVAKCYATAMPRSVAVAKGVDYFVPFVPDEQVTTEIDGGAYLAAKTAAMGAHATQIVVDGDRFALSSGRWQPLLAQEYYTLLAWGDAPPGTPRGADGALPAGRQAPSRALAGPSAAAHGTREHDLFAGLDGR